MDVIRGPYYSLNYRILYVTGQWPYLSKSQKWIRGTITVSIAMTFLVPLWLGLFEVIGDLNLMTKCIPALIVNSAGMLMFFNSVINHDELKKLFTKMETDWITWSSKPEIRILRKYAQMGKKFRTRYFVILLGNWMAFLILRGIPMFLDIIKPLNISRPREDIVIIEYGVDSEKYQDIIYLHICFSSIMNRVLLFNTDMLLMASAQHTCGILAAIGCRVRNLSKYEHNLSHDGINLQNEIKKDIIFCIKEHIDLINFLKTIHRCFSFVFFVTVALNMVILSLTGFQVIINLDRSKEVFLFAIITIAQMIHLFYITLPCQQMIDHSLSLSDSVYKSNWYNLPSQYRKLLLMIMMRSSEPFEFIVGKMYTYSKQNFGMVLKTSISYFTVLCSVQ